MNYISNKNPVLDHLSRELVSDCLGKVNQSNLLQLEAWRRGLRLNLYKNNQLFQLSSNERVLNFRYSFCTDYTEYSHLAKYYCKYKQRTKKYFQKAALMFQKERHSGSLTRMKIL
jgi:hypothetical protein